MLGLVIGEDNVDVILKIYGVVFEKVFDMIGIID